MKKRGVSAYDNQIENFARSDANELDRFSELLQEEAKKYDIPVEEDVDTLKNQIGNDIRKNIPPQLYAVVSGIVEVIGRLEDENNAGEQG